MIVEDLHVVGVAVFPPENDTPLVIDANAVKVFPVAFKQFEPV
jgi:hypothetical protein